MNFIKKMKSGRGVTIGEMLTALLIMVFLTLTVAGGAGVALKVYRTQTCYSESRVLANSILVAMAEELRYASEAEVSADSNSISYNSRTYGAGAVMDIEPWSADTGGGRLRIQYDKGEDGEAEGGKTDYPYGDATYTGFHVEAVEDKKVFEAGAEAGSVLISYNICDGQGKIWAAIKDLELRFLNGPEE